METSGRALEFARRYGACVIAVDESGVGGGVLDRMREVGGIASLGVNVGRAARNSERFANLRAELFNGLKLRFNNGDIEIPDDREWFPSWLRCATSSQAGGSYSWNPNASTQVLAGRALTRRMR